MKYLLHPEADEEFAGPWLRFPGEGQENEGQETFSCRNILAIILGDASPRRIAKTAKNFNRRVRGIGFPISTHNKFSFDSLESKFAKFRCDQIVISRVIDQSNMLLKFRRKADDKNATIKRHWVCL